MTPERPSHRLSRRPARPSVAPIAIAVLGLAIGGIAQVSPAASAARVTSDKASQAFYATCMKLTRTNARRALSEALAFDATGAAFPARHCAATAMLRLGRSADAAVMLEGVAGELDGAATRQFRSRVYHQAAQAWLRAMDIARADGALGRSIALDGYNSAARLDRGLLRAQTNRMGDAIVDFDAVVANEPKNVTALVLRAAAYRKLKRLYRAEADLKRALSLQPKHPDALLERGIVRLARRDLPGARADWRQVLKVAPRSAAAVVARRKLVKINLRLK